MMNIDGNEGILAAIMTLIMGAAAWIRGERIKNAKAGKIIAGDTADKTIALGHTEEFKRLQDAVAKLMPLSQEVEMLKAKLAGIWVYCEMLLLCDTCATMNEKIIKKMQETLDPVVKATDTTLLQQAKDFIEENYK